MQKNIRVCNTREVMNEINDVTGKEITRGHQKRNSENRQPGLDQLFVDRTGNGHQEQIEVGDHDLKRGTCGYVVKQRDTGVGKILERLEALEQKTLAYLHAHQDRLETRLKESKQSEIDFLDTSSQLKGDLLELLIQPNDDDEIDV
jgi:hypothetical protein